jgi:D-alanyl-D-alanine carboxypeptidase
MSQVKYNQRTEHNIATLQPDFAERVRSWLAEARKQGLNPLVHFGARSIEEQEELHQISLKGGPKAVAPERSYHCYGRAFDWVNITDPDGGERGLAFNDNKAYKKGTKIAEQFEIRGIGESDNDHLQDARFPKFADLPKTEFGKFPSMIA